MQKVGAAGKVPACLAGNWGKPWAGGGWRLEWCDEGEPEPQAGGGHPVEPPQGGSRENGV